MASAMPNQRVTLDGVIASEEVKVHTGSYSAEYGMNNVANVQVALKSGTNDFHGTFFEFSDENECYVYYDTTHAKE